LIRLTRPSIEADDLRAVEEVLRSGYLVQGQHVAVFERALEQYVGTRFAVAVSNGTAALYLALMALGVERGNAVAVTAYSWPATANVIVLCGATPIFVDIDPQTYNMDPDALGRALATTRCKAILPVHTFGGMADVKAIGDISRKYEVPIIEDAACALGTSFEDRKAGTWGGMGCFSFHPRKAITTGEGGAITTDNAAWARKLRQLRNHGVDPEAAVPDFVEAGFNMRLTEFQAALGTTQLAKLERIIEARRRCAKQYDALFADSEVAVPRSLPGSRHVYQSYVVLLPAQAASRRAAILAALRNQGIEATVGTYHIPMTTFFREKYGFRQGDFPVSDDVASRAVTLPLFEGLQSEQQQEVADGLLVALRL